MILKKHVNRSYQQLLIGSALWGVTLFAFTNSQISNSLIAQALSPPQTIDSLSLMTTVQSSSPVKFTSVSQLLDVAPTDWAFQTLLSFVERYSCIEGYPSLSDRNHRSLTRLEFAAELNTCLKTIEQLLQKHEAIPKEDIDKLKQLVQEYQAESAVVPAQIDHLDLGVDVLKDHQFSATTTLRGEVIFGVADALGNKVSNGDLLGGDGESAQTTFQNRVRLNFETSFLGTDFLRTRLQAGNAGGQNRLDAASATGTNMTRLIYDAGVNNQVTVNQLFYRTSVGSATFLLGAIGVGLDTVFDPINPLLGSGATGALSRLQLQNNIVYSAPANTGAAVTLRNDRINFTVTYLSDEAADPSQGAGLFNGNYSAGAQLSFNIKNTYQIAATYVHSYQEGSPLFGGVSSTNTEFPYGNNPTSADRFGLQANFWPLPRLSLNAWGGYAKVRDENGIFDNQDVWSWNASAALSDVFFEGSLLWVGGGLPPKASSEESSSYIIETGFRILVNDNISITPGGYVILNPNNNDSNPPIYIGVIRTTFLF